MLTHHRTLDCSCSEIDREDIPYGSSGLTVNLCEDLGERTLHWLKLHYPELIFGSTSGTKKPIHDYCRSVKGGWRWADWRTK